MHESKRQRRSIRLQGYDYAQRGAYFLTIVAKNRDALFGEIRDNEMVLNAFGEIAAQCWLAIPTHFPDVDLDLFVIMPNHLHGILLVVRDSTVLLAPRASFRSPSRTVGSVVRGFKIGVSKAIREAHGPKEIWQRNYYEHIIRDEDALDRIREYILANPRNWQFDQENPASQNHPAVKEYSANQKTPERLRGE